MKLVMQLIIVAVFAFACKEKKHSAFTVSGMIENAPGKKVLLMETPYANPQPVILDSTTLDAKGKFTLRGRANEEGIYRLLLENGPSVILINDNDKLTLNMDVNDYRNYNVQGSPASQSLHNLFEDYRSKDSGIFSTFRKIDELRSQPGQDNAIQILQRVNEKQVSEMNELLKNYIENAESPAAAFYALGMADQTMSKEEVSKLLDGAVVKFPQHAGLARIKKLYAARQKKATTDDQAPATDGYALLNKQAPDLTMNDVNGKPVSISSFKGKYVLVDFWASWCGPCRQENPNVVAAHNMFKDKNFTVLGVSLDENKAAWLKAISADNLTWSHMSDLKGWQSAAVNTYGFKGIPFNVLLDPSGKIIASDLREEDLTSKLKELLH